MTTTKLSRLRLDVLGAVAAHSSLTTAEVARHLLIDYTTARTALVALERMNLTARVYTGRSFTANGYGWSATPAGQAEANKDEAA